MAVLPKNLSMLVQRLANFNRQTIRVRAMSNDSAGPGQSIVFRFPSNTIVDLHNLQLKATLNSQCVVTVDAAGVKTGLPTDACKVSTELGMPKYSQSLFERVDVTVGGTQITGSNTDYGALYTIIRDQIGGTANRSSFGDMELSSNDPEYKSNLLHLFQNEEGQPVNVGVRYSMPQPSGSPWIVDNSVGKTHKDLVQPGPSAGGNFQTISTGSTALHNGTADRAFDGQLFKKSGTTAADPLTKKQTVVWQGFLGFLGGKFVRFIDTAITGAIEVRIRLAPQAVTWGPQSIVKGSSTALSQGMVHTKLSSRTADYSLSHMYMVMDTISFTDDFYRQHLARRLIEGGSLVIPYDNYFSIQKQVGSSDTMTFNVATQSLDYLIGTLRHYKYADKPSEIGIFEAEISGPLAIKYGAGDTAEIPQYVKNGVYTSPSDNCRYYTFTSGAPATHEDTPGCTYQWLVANQMVPNFPAGVDDVWTLNQAAMDLANNIGDIGTTQTHYEFRRGKFAHIVCFCHHGEQEKFISGLDTRGASSNMQWMVSGLSSDLKDLGNATETKIEKYVAHVWACCTSTIEISAGQNIVVIF